MGDMLDVFLSFCHCICIIFIHSFIHSFVYE